MSTGHEWYGIPAATGFLTCPREKAVADPVPVMNDLAP